MARHRGGRDVSGWIVVDKPAGISSTAVVNRVRWALDARKAGHAGTLDPIATGVLAVALGEATKTVPYVTEATKAYRFVIRLGTATSTDDAEGEVVAMSELRPTDGELKEALPGFVGEIMQVPPRYSAVKVDGRRAYARARAGEEIELAARPLHVERLTFIGRPDPDLCELELVCGKGGYVRSIARDLGEALGCRAHVTELRRLRSGPFNVEDGVSMDILDALAKSPELDGFLRPLECGLAGLPELRTTREGAVRMKNGNPGLVLSAGAEYGDAAWASLDDRAVAVGTYRAGKLHPTRVFHH